MTAPPCPSLTELDAMDRDDLIRLWTGLLNTPVPRKISRPLMVRILATELQTRRHGGLTRAEQRKLQAMAKPAPASQRSSKTTPRKTRRQAERPLPGARLIREWNGVAHVVDVTDQGYLWNGKPYRSLSAVARAITGARWSGPRFFGLIGKHT